MNFRHLFLALLAAGLAGAGFGCARQVVVAEVLQQPQNGKIYNPMTGTSAVAESLWINIDAVTGLGVSRQEIEKHKLSRSNGPFNSCPEYEETQHIGKEMPYSAMHKHICHELPVIMAVDNS